MCPCSQKCLLSCTCRALYFRSCTFPTESVVIVSAINAEIPSFATMARWLGVPPPFFGKLSSLLFIFGGDFFCVQRGTHPCLLFPLHSFGKCGFQETLGLYVPPGHGSKWGQGMGVPLVGSEVHYSTLLHVFPLGKTRLGGGALHVLSLSPQLMWIKYMEFLKSIVSFSWLYLLL